MTSKPADAILVCLRTADLVRPHAPSSEGQCSMCGASIWVAKSSPEAMIEMCLPCASPYVLDKDAKIEPITQKQIDDVVRYRWR